MLDVIVYKDRRYEDSIRIKDGLLSTITFLKNQSKLTYKILPYNANPEPCQVAVIWSVHNPLKPNTKYRDNIKKFQTKNNCKLLVMELGFLNRNMYYSLGFNAHVGYGNYPFENITNDRFDKLDISLSSDNWSPNGHILICGQITHDSQLTTLKKPYKQWLRELVLKIKEHTDKDIVFRPHPKQKSSHPITVDSLPGCRTSIAKTIAEDFKNCYLAVGYNSNSLLEALTYGLPVLVFDKGSVVYDLGIHKIDGIENISPPIHDKDFLNHMNKVAHMQWNSEEIKNGEAWNFLFKN